MNAEQIEQARSVLLERVAERYQLRLKRQGSEQVGPCPVCGGVDRFAINIRKQRWNCRGCRTGGDVIALVQHVDDVDFPTAIHILCSEPPPCDARRQAPARSVPTSCEYERQQHRKAEWMWRHRLPLAGSLAEVYLRSCRAYRGALPPTLAFLPAHKPEHHPAMIAAFADAREIKPGVLAAPDAVSAVHVTLLRPDGTGKAGTNRDKFAVARALGYPIVIAPPNDTLGLAIAEGIEDALSAHQATGLGAWAAGSGSLMPALAARVPSYVEVVTIFAHDDTTGRAGARGLAERLRARGIEVRVEGATL